MYVIAVNKSQEFLLHVCGLFLYFFDDNAAVFTSMRRIFLNDNARDSTLTTSFFDDVVQYTTAMEWMLD